MVLTIFWREKEEEEEIGSVIGSAFLFIVVDCNERTNDGMSLGWNVSYLRFRNDEMNRRIENG